MAITPSSFSSISSTLAAEGFTSVGVKPAFFGSVKADAEVFTKRGTSVPAQTRRIVQQQIAAAPDDVESWYIMTHKERGWLRVILRRPEAA